MSELEIPDVAYEAAEAAVMTYVAEGDALDAASEAINIAAPLIVVAELRRLARLWVGDAQRPGPIGATPTEIRVRTWFQAADGLNDRADQLDPEGRTR